jgi:hypothetical protein
VADGESGLQIVDVSNLSIDGAVQVVRNILQQLGMVNDAS